MIKEVTKPGLLLLIFFYSVEDTHYFVNPASLFLEIASLFSIHMAVRGTVMLWQGPIPWFWSLSRKVLWTGDYGNIGSGYFYLSSCNMWNLGICWWLIYRHTDWDVGWRQPGTESGRQDFSPCFLIPVHVLVKVSLCPDNISPFCLTSDLLSVTCYPQSPNV